MGLFTTALDEMNESNQKTLWLMTGFAFLVAVIALIFLRPPDASNTNELPPVVNHDVTMEEIIAGIKHQTPDNAIKSWKMEMEKHRRRFSWGEMNAGIDQLCRAIDKEQGRDVGDKFYDLAVVWTNGPEGQQYRNER